MQISHRRSRLIITYLLLTVLGGMILFYISIENESHVRTVYADTGFGGTDFIAFWAAGKAFLSGQNPYNPQVILEIQKIPFPDRVHSQLFLNPPWALPFFSILGLFPFHFVRWLWIVLNVLIIGLTGLIIPLLSKDNQASSKRAVFASLLFLPHIFLLFNGQISLFIFASLLLGIFYYREQKWWLVALCVLPVSLKPHIFLPLIVYWAIAIFLKKEFKLMAYIATGFSILIGLVLLVDHGNFLFWSQSEFSALNYQSSTITAAIRLAIFNCTGNLPSWPAYLIPMLGIVMAIFYGKKNGYMLTRRTLTNLTCLSLVCVPYCWPYDFSILVIVQVVMVLEGVTRQNQKIKPSVFLLLLIPNIGLIVTGLFVQTLFYFFWYPAVVWGVYFLFCRNQRTLEL